MTAAVPLLEIWRGEMLESLHMGYAVVCDSAGGLVEAWGAADKLIYPRSSCKMLQALPLLESGAAGAARLTSEQLALASASHSGAAIHTDRVRAWLSDLGLEESDFKCGPQEPSDRPARDALITAGRGPCRLHNNCSGKHSGFLTLSKHLRAGPDYVAIDHPVQQAVRAAFEDMTGEASPGYGVDGCSAPNFVTSLQGLARSMARMAKGEDGSARGKAAAQLVEAMMLHPELVAGEGRACTELMRAMNGAAAVKTGAEGVFVAILPGRGLGMAVKAEDGATRAAEAAITALLTKYGVLDPSHPVALKYTVGPIRNWDGKVTGRMRLGDGLAVGHAVF